MALQPIDETKESELRVVCGVSIDDRENTRADCSRPLPL